jgi:hypothetical protein
MTAILPVTIFLLVNAAWITTGVVSSRLLRLFEAKFPREAAERIPYAFTHWRHPEKLLFFFRKSSLPILQQDAAVWKLRQRLRLLLMVSILLPIIGCLAILLTALPALLKGE